MKVRVHFGQDTPAYAIVTVEIPDGADPVQYVKDNADKLIEDVVFEPAYDWDGLRIVEMVKCDGGDEICSDVPIGHMPYHDKGLLAVQIINENWVQLLNANASGDISDELLLKLRDLTRL